MGRGGYRPGAGRPRGTKKKGEEKEPIDNKNKQQNQEEGKFDPLTYALKVINDPDADPELRARLAIAALPFFHSKVQEGKKSKKEESNEKAKTAGSGRFKVSMPPRR